MGNDHGDRPGALRTPGIVSFSYLATHAHSHRLRNEGRVAFLREIDRNRVEIGSEDNVPHYL